MERKTVVVGGQKVELELRICPCGCKSTFWVVPSSKQYFARKDCRNGGATQSWVSQHREKALRVVQCPTQEFI